MKVALVYDRVNKWGGAERVLLALHEIWPEAPLYTAVYDPERAPWAEVFRIKPSFLQHLPWAKSHHELYPWLTPLAFETFNFDEYDLVLSVTSAEAKGIITKPKTCHIGYCLTPTRYLWSGFAEHQRNPGMGWLNGPVRVMHALWTPTLRRWDKIAASRPDYYLAISERVKERIEQYYERKVADVIYPPVDIDKFKIKNLNFKIDKPSNYFLVVSRLVSYKRVDLVIEAFNELGWPLVIIGDGFQKRELQRKARPNVTLVDHYLTDEELRAYYQNCRGLIHAADEDFGLVAVEAQAAGKPVVSFSASGAAETIIDGKTGALFDQPDKRSLIEALRRLKTVRIEPAECQANARRFGKDRFAEAFRRKVNELYHQYRSDY